MSQQRLGITIDLDELESLMHAYCHDSYDGDKGDLQRRLTLSGFISWLRNRQRRPKVIKGDFNGSPKGTAAN